MQQCDVGVPRRAGVDTEPEGMVRRQTEVIRGTGIDEGEPAGGIRVPGVGRDLVERGLQLGRKRADVRGVNHRRQIYGALTGWQWPTPPFLFFLMKTSEPVSRAQADWASARRPS